MFINFYDELEMIDELKQRVGELVVLHYECEDCGTDQVTDELEITSDMIDDLQADGYFMCSWPCTDCGANTKFMRTDMMRGIEY
ncbi:MAG: hypothetical protein K0R00_223 [Herbinix sp.]|jgi:hypothetical protein|nr:hypothetical protein [Herbinix sp.]